MQLDLNRFNYDDLSCPIYYLCKECGSEIINKDKKFWCPKCNKVAEWEYEVRITVE
jgi:rubrerythrin